MIKFSKRKLLLCGIDVFAFIGSFTFISLCEYLLSGTGDALRTALNALVFFAAIFGSRILLLCYNNVWRYASAKTYLQLIIADLIGFILGCILTRGFDIWLEIWLTSSKVALFFIATFAARFAYQVFYRCYLMVKGESKFNKISVAIVGAGQTGFVLCEELMYSESSHYNPICFVDCSNDKKGSRVLGLEVFSEDESVYDKLSKKGVQEVFIAIPRLTGQALKEKCDFYQKTGCKIKIFDVPLKDYDNTENAKPVLREVKIEDLLFRDSLKIVDGVTRKSYEDKIVLVTGGGGSIGSELCRQIAKCSPKKLIIFDIYENNAYSIQQELLRKYKDKLDLTVEIGSVRDRERLEAVFAAYKPQVVFHAAAHKHVPLMEHSNAEAIKNNCLGTYNTADMAEKYGASKFILISTDKAVNPTNIMGASKRMCEMIIQCRRDSSTTFAAVRFGNVLGSNGSVIPLFRSQIESGGPITVTDKRIIRYFMTIPEASQLVMQAGAMAKCGELFVLDMGKPVKIIDLAENMIKLSGLKPYTDIDIVEIGLRPGEKLYEELLIKTEKLDKTDNNMIFIERDTPYSREEIEEKLDILRSAVRDAVGELESDKIVKAMRSVVSTFVTPEEVNARASESDEFRAVALS